MLPCFLPCSPSVDPHRRNRVVVFRYFVSSSLGCGHPLKGRGALGQEAGARWDEVRPHPSAFARSRAKAEDGCILVLPQNYARFGRFSLVTP